MSREIEFRAWHDGKMVYDVGVCQSCVDGTQKVVQDQYERISILTSAIPMQFTGLLDCNGVKIFEGDIVVIPEEYIWFDNGEPNYRGVVEMIYSSWGVTAHCVNSEKRGISSGMNYELNDDGFDDNSNSTWLVIGNIHQHPELLP